MENFSPSCIWETIFEMPCWNTNLDLSSNLLVISISNTTFAALDEQKLLLFDAADAGVSFTNGRKNNIVIAVIYALDPK